MFRRRLGGGRDEPPVAQQSTRRSFSQAAELDSSRRRASSSSGAEVHHRSNKGDYDEDGHDNNSENEEGHVLWCGISRDAALLVQGGDRANIVDPTTHSSRLTEAAQQLLDKPATAGFEFHTYHQPFLSSSSLPGGRLLQRGNRRQLPPWRGVKFHVFEEALENESAAAGSAGAVPGTGAGVTTWVYAAVYQPHPTHLTQRHMQAFLEKLVVLTEPLRCRDAAWRHGPTEAVQRSFGLILEQQIRDVRGSQGGGATELLHGRLEAAQAQMQRNIEVLLDREERLQSLHDRAGDLNEAARVFRKNTRRVRRLKMLQDAKHGILIGTAVTIGVAIVVVPPLVALL